MVILVSALALVALTVSLGRWQLSRAQQKQALQDTISVQSARAVRPLAEFDAVTAADAGALYRAVSASGQWLHAYTVFLDNRQMDGRPGFFVVTPLLLPHNAGAVLVQRGWVPRDVSDRSRLPNLNAPLGEVTLSARIVPPPGRLFAFEGPDEGRIRQNIDLDAFRAETGLALWSVSLQQLAVESPAPTPDPLQRRWPAPAVDVHKHHGYAAQWFGLALLTTALYVWFQILRPRRSPRPSRTADDA